MRLLGAERSPWATKKKKIQEVRKLEGCEKVNLWEVSWNEDTYDQNAMYICMKFSKIIHLKCKVTVNKGTEKWSKARRVSEKETEFGKEILDKW